MIDLEWLLQYAVKICARKIVKKQALFIIDEVWQYLVCISTLTATKSGAHKIHVSHMNILFMNLSCESFMLLH
jgi:hypothetical protein